MTHPIESPYADTRSHRATPRAESRGAAPAAQAPAKAAAKSTRKSTGRAAPARARKSAAPAAEREPAAAKRPSRRRRSRGGGAYAAPQQLTSVPTSRNAYVETRQWLLGQHGPICAYCGKRFTAQAMTLDHVQPRRGQTAFDRRDNLVLACTPCNAAKRDLPPLAFLLAVRTRAANLLRYGAHLSPMLLDLAKGLAPEVDLSEPIEAEDDGLGDFGRWDDEESPYKD